MSATNKPKDPNKILKNAHDEARFVFADYYHVKPVIDSKREKFEEWYQAYRGILDWGKLNVTTKVVTPLIYTNVEDALPRLVANLPQVDVGPRGPEDQVRADKYRSLLMWDWDIMKKPMQLILIAKAGEIFGTVFTKMAWKKQVETRVSREARPTMAGRFGVADLLGRPKRVIDSVITQVPVYNDPIEKVYWPDQVFPDLDCSSIDDAAFVITREKVTISSLEGAMKDDEPLYKKDVLRMLRQKVGSGNPASDEIMTLEQRILREHHEHGSKFNENNPSKQQVHILERWSPTQICVVVEEFPDLPPIRLEYNDIGRIPILAFTPIPDVGNLYGISIPETLMVFQVMESLLHGATIDNIMYSVHQMWKVTMTSGIRAKNLHWRAGGIIPVKRMGDIEPLTRQGTDFSVYRTLEEIRRMSQKAGFSDTFSGLKSDLTGGTATEASLLFEASQTRVSLMFQILGLQYLNDWGRLAIRLNELYMDEDKPIRIMGDEFVEDQTDIITPEDILTGTGLDLHVRIDIAQTEPANRQFRLARAKDMLQTLGQLGMPFQHPIMQLMLSELLRGYGKNNPEALLGGGNNPNPDAQAIEQALLQQALGGGPGGGPGPALEQLAGAAESVPAGPAEPQGMESALTEILGGA